MNRFLNLQANEHKFSIISMIGTNENQIMKSMFVSIDSVEDLIHITINTVKRIIPFLADN
ncbi:6693_t:CDS:2 [Diversispora eburnea]|uniref:6693_t:CDS:1 n=1 Tax=Diversispora eburnea TaxID=1213867 RepID=A0A9N8YML7_9GLOM|nr:6693_t:CDS:2 [Diversispora eburnea]